MVTHSAGNAWPNEGNVFGARRTGLGCPSPKQKRDSTMIDEPESALASPFAPFKHSTYRAIWIANLSSNFGGLIQAVGAAWLMTSITDSANMVALVQASTALPI